MSGYHSIELCYLAAVYTNLLITEAAAGLLLQAACRAASSDDILRVAPDMLPPGSVRIDEVWIDGEPYTNFDAEALTVKRLPGQREGPMRVKVRAQPGARVATADDAGSRQQIGRDVATAR